VSPCLQPYIRTSERIVQSDIAMTGEISLRGLVLPVGALRRKSLLLPGQDKNRHASGTQPKRL